MMNITIGKKLQAVRDKLGLTQKQVSEYLGINSTQLSYYENGKREIGLADLNRLAQLYGYSIEYFVKEDSVMDENDISLAFKAGEINDEDMKVVLWARRFINNLHDMQIRSGRI
jgi:transcriptional regulator with XRE-family HTH domain